MFTVLLVAAIVVGGIAALVTAAWLYAWWAERTQEYLPRHRVPATPAHPAAPPLARANQDI